MKESNCVLLWNEEALFAMNEEVTLFTKFLQQSANRRRDVERTTMGNGLILNMHFEQKKLSAVPLR